MTAQLPPNEIVTPPFRLAFAHLFEKAPKADGSDKLTFQAGILIPPGTDLQPYANCMGAAMMAKWNQFVTLAADKHPLRRAETKTNHEGEAYEGFLPGWFYIQTHSGYRPSVLDEHGQDVYREPPMADEAKRKAAKEAAQKVVYSGCWCRFHLSAYGWHHKLSGNGVSFGIEGVLKVRDDESFAGRNRTDSHEAFGIAKPAAAPGAVIPHAAPGGQLDVSSFLG